MSVRATNSNAERNPETHVFSPHEAEKGVFSSFFSNVSQYISSFSWPLFNASSSPNTIPFTAAKPLSVHEIPEIPSFFHNDPIFQKYICPITLTPIRFILFDPNDKSFYEKSAILKWTTHQPISPLTRASLLQTSLIEHPSVQALIDYRLNEYLQKFPQLFERYRRH